MPVKAIPKVSIARNGVGSFVPPCHRITIQYCNWGGSSTHLRKVLANGQMDKYINSKPHVFFEVVKARGHPKLTFRYVNKENGKASDLLAQQVSYVTQEVDIKNLPELEIFKKLDEYYSRSGNELFKFNHKVKSINDSVRGIWSPLQTLKGYRHKI
ncbi:54S ribosomal protein L51, mitochondrial [Candida viswanathii]|uniref:Large ribosomal subunit protein mL43 n=1 Tax=Candida viswanathii TaxID=5486 RepID=A0A367YBK4_9ASCO|nr:54S ribosomal protein L51, mitochondrial [Candida viswanathii]